MARKPAADAACPKDADANPHPETPDDDERWAEAERLFADPIIRVSEIAKRVGLATVRINCEAARRGWPPRPPTRKSRALPNAGNENLAAQPSDGTDAAANVSQPTTRGRKSANVVPEPSKKRPPKPRDLLHHVCSTIEGELTKLDRQSGDTSQDRERASRALSQMVNSLEKTIGMQSEIEKDTTKGAAKKNKEELAHAEDLRRAIAERLERLQRKRVPDAGSADTDSE